MARTIVAVLVAPAFVGALVTVTDSLMDLLLGRDPWSGPLVEAVFVFSYLFALIPAAIVMFALKRLRLLKVWHFALAGFAAALVCTTIFVLISYRGYATESLRAFLSEFLELSRLLVIGPITGVCVWLMSESRLPGRKRSP
jgi:hypothetical protein